MVLQTQNQLSSMAISGPNLHLIKKELWLSRTPWPVCTNKRFLQCIFLTGVLINNVNVGFISPLNKSTQMEEFLISFFMEHDAKAVREIASRESTLQSRK